MAVKFALFLVAIGYFEQASGHGMMLMPPNRGSLWRYDWTLAPHYNDNEFFCGGVPAQFGKNGGKCGFCGDNYADPVPRSNENGGHYGNGVILREYPAGGVIDTTVILTANHMGIFTYSLCSLPTASTLETEECFVNLRLVDGSSTYRVKWDDYEVNNKVQLPAGFSCKHCVLRWHYEAANSWGICHDGSEKIGCGAQETFRSCSDIRIV